MIFLLGNCPQTRLVTKAHQTGHCVTHRFRSWAPCSAAHRNLCLSVPCVQLGLTVAILVLVRYQLQGMSTVAVDGKLTLAETCYLSLPEDWTGACVYGEAYPAELSAGLSSPLARTSCSN